MGHLKQVHIRRFKRLEDISLCLDGTNVLIGANNAGKSSVLQAIHFAVSVAQTSKLLGGVSWRQDSYELSFNPSQLLYSPVADVMALASGGTLIEDANRRVEIQFQSSDDRTTTVAVRRGRNRNIGVSIEGRSLGEELQNLIRPFSVYAPGLAGVAREEYYMSPGRVRRIVARGDANLVLRNVLLMLQQDKTAWDQFCEDVSEIFPGLSIRLKFEETTEEHITALFSVDSGPDLPIESAGTSILQSTQLLAYVALFRPNLFILDEPDSHLHPNNQRALCRVITKIAKERGVQIILSTHSRHMIDGLRKKAQVVWLSKGSLVPPPDGEGPDLTEILLDLGALDSIDYFSNGQARFVVATEDEDTACLKEILWSSGFNKDEVEVVSYSGCTKIDSAIVLGKFLRAKAPNIKMIVHRDRDYMSDRSVSKFKLALKQHDIIPFVTERSDIEHYYCNVDHLQKCYPTIDRDVLDGLLEQAVGEARDESIKVIINLRTEEAYRERNKGGPSPDHGQISSQANKDYDANPRAMSRGKLVLNRVKNLLQSMHGLNAKVHRASDALSIPELRAIAEGELDDSTSQLSSGPSSDVLVVDTDGAAVRNAPEDVVHVEHAVSAHPPSSQTFAAVDTAPSANTDDEGN